MNKLRARTFNVLPIVLMVAAISGLAGCGGDEPAPAPTAAPAETAPVAAQPAEPAAATNTTPTTVPELLDAARVAMREQRLILPAGSNAIEYYLKVLDAEPDNRHAQLAILELMPLAQGVAEQMIDTNKLEEAQAAVGLLKRAQPTSVVVTNLEQRIVTQRRAEEQRLKAEEEAARLAERQSREQPAAAVAPAVTEPAPATTTPSRPAVAATTPATTSPATPGPGATTQPTKPTQVASAEPAKPIAASTAPQNKDFSLVKRVNPSYPSQALRARTEGWVELSFTITTDGSVEGVEVVDASPRRVFDREAMRALGQWKFSPRVEGGKPVAAKARQRLEFSLN